MHRLHCKILIVLSLLFSVPTALCAASLIQSKYASISETAFIINLLSLGLLFGLLWYNIFLAISTKEKMFFYFSWIMVLLTVLQTFAAYERFFFYLTYNKVTVITHLLFVTFLLFFEELFSIYAHDK